MRAQSAAFLIEAPPQAEGIGLLPNSHHETSSIDDTGGGGDGRENLVLAECSMSCLLLDKNLDSKCDPGKIKICNKKATDFGLMALPILSLSTLHDMNSNNSSNWRCSSKETIRGETFPFNDQSMTIQTFWMFYQPKPIWPVKEMVKKCEKNPTICTIFEENLSSESNYFTKPL